MAPRTSQNMINGEQNLHWLWFIHHGSQEVGPVEETWMKIHIPCGHQKGTGNQDGIFSASCTQLPNCFLCYSTSKCLKFSPPCLSSRAIQKRPTIRVVSQFSVYALWEKRRKPMFIHCWLWASQFDMFFHWTATTALEGELYYFLQRDSMSYSRIHFLHFYKEIFFLQRDSMS